MDRISAFDLDGPRVAPQSGAAPSQLVVFLHGVGADGNDLISLAPFFARVLPGAAFVSPNAPFPCDMAPFGYQWFSLQQRTPEAILGGVRLAAPILDAFIDAELERLGLQDRDLALIGFSQGTMMALHVALRRAKPCAALIGFSGMLVGAESLAEEIVSRPPVLLVHGEADEVIPAQALPAADQGLRAAGVTVSAHRRPGLGHGIDEQGIALAQAALAKAFAPEDRGAPMA